FSSCDARENKQPFRSVRVVRRRSAPQDSAKRATHQGATDRTTDRTRNLLAEVSGDLTSDFVGHRARDFARNDLSGREPLPTRPAGAEDAAEDAAEIAEQPAGFRHRLALRGAARRIRVLGAFLQNFERGFAIDRRVVFALQWAVANDCLALVRCDDAD